VQLNSRTHRREVRTAIETALATGLETIRNLDVVVANAARRDRVRFEAWRAARRIEGLNHKPSPHATTPTSATEPPVALPKAS
jgi:hypothetical protein